MSINSVSGFGNATPVTPTPAGATEAVPEARKAPAPTPVTREVKPPSQQQVEAAVKHVAGVIQSRASDLKFSIDHDTGKTIVRITDQKTGEMIRQIPSAEMVEIAKSLDKMQGMLLKQNA